MSTPSKSGAMSEMARELARTDTLKIDHVLAPVRECLEGLRNGHGCWCHKPDIAHSGGCERAQQLYERLKIQ